jgi:hypothetical protein
MKYGVKGLFPVLALIAGLCACAATNPAAGKTPAVTVPALDAALRGAAENFMARIPEKRIIAVAAMETEERASGSSNQASDYQVPEALCEYISEELRNYIEGTGVYTLIEKRNLPRIEGELEYQAGGMVDDESAQRIGHLYGAQTLIYGKVQPFAGGYRLALYATDVETGESRQQILNTKPDPRFPLEKIPGDLETVIERGISRLGRNYNGRINAAVGLISLHGTQTVTNLSDFLKGRIGLYAAGENSKFRISAGAGEGAPVQALIEGYFNPLGDGAEALLQLVGNTPDRPVLGSSRFTLSAQALRERGLSALPPQGDAIIAQSVYEEKRRLIEPYQGKNNAFKLSVQPDHIDKIYYDQDLMSFKIYAERDCYIKITQVDVYGNVQQIYPLHPRDNPRIRAGETRILPDNNKFRLRQPWGEEYILIAAYDRPYDIQAQREAQLSGAVITRSMMVRGMDVIPGNVPGPGPEMGPSATTLFSYTILPRR